MRLSSSLVAELSAAAVVDSPKPAVAAALYPRAWPRRISAPRWLAPGARHGAPGSPCSSTPGVARIAVAG
eukprot:1525889-Ditylum_brightwellii.AAC.1